MTTNFHLFVPATWLPALQETIQHALENADAIEFDLFAPVRFVWHWFWWLVGKIIKALALGFASLVAVIIYAAGPFGWWSIPLGLFVLIFVTPVAFVIWLMIWAGVLTIRFCSWAVRAILHKPADRKAQKVLHNSHWFSRNLFIIGLIMLIVWFPIGLLLIFMSILYTVVDQAIFWWRPKTAQVEVREA